MISKAIVCFCLFSYGCLASESINNDIRTEEENFERPCRLFDMYCIRQFFVKHSHCKEALGPFPTPLYRDQFTVYFPAVNLTVTLLKANYTGLNGRVVEFYFNKKTDKLLLAVQFTNLRLSTNESHYRFHRRGKEPVETVDFVELVNPSVLSTIIIPHIKDLQIQDSEVYTAIGPGAAFVTGPNAFASTDPVVIQAFLELAANFQTLIREAYLTESPFFIASFIKYNICDFGLEFL